MPQHDPYRDLRARLVRERIDKGLNQTDLARQLDWSAARLSQHENGFVKFLTVDALHNWADALGMDIQLCCFLRPRNIDEWTSYDFKPEPPTGGYTGPAS